MDNETLGVLSMVFFLGGLIVTFGYMLYDFKKHEKKN